MNYNLFKKMGSMACAFALMIGVVGCDLNEKEKVMIAQNAGLLGITTWIAIDNPDANDMATVRSAVAVMKATSNVIDEGESFTMALYPVASEWVMANVDGNEQALALAGVTVVLNGLDLYFTQNPPEDLDEALLLANAFFEGVDAGLSLSPQSEVMRVARQGYQVRVESLSVGQ